MSMFPRGRYFPEPPIDPPEATPLTTCPKCGVEEAVDSAGDCYDCGNVSNYDPSEEADDVSDNRS